MGIVGDKDTLFLSLILFFQDRKDFLEGALVYLIMLAQVPEKNFMGKLVVPAEIFKAPDPAIGGNGFRRAQHGENRFDGKAGFPQRRHPLQPSNILG